MQKTHKQKVRMARKMMAPWEIRLGIPTFQSSQWRKRKEAKRFAEIKKIKKGLITG